MSHNYHEFIDEDGVAHVIPPEGLPVEVRDVAGEDWRDAILLACRLNAVKNYLTDIGSWSMCRLRPEKKTRLMTVEELWGKTLVRKGDQSGLIHAQIVTRSCGDSICGFYGGDTVLRLHRSEWRLSPSGKPTMEGSVSLEVEE